MIEQLEFFKQAALAHLQKTRGEKSSGSKKKEKSDECDAATS